MAKKTLQARELTTSETAAIFWHVFGGEENWRRIYQAAANWTDEDMAQKVTQFSTYVSRWKTSEKVKKEVERVKLLKDVMLQKARQEAFEDGKKAAMGDAQTSTAIRMEVENGRVEESRARALDYTDPVRQKEKLNEIINNAKDSGEALDALKVIIQGQKNDQEAAKDKQVQRFYVPLRCYECPLYLEKKK